jgi:hypothetical protein
LTIQRTLKGLFLAGLASLALAVPALAAPAGKEYLPKVPKSAGQQVVAHGTEGPGGTVLEPKARGAGGKNGGDSKADPNATGAVDTSSGDDSGSTIFNPIVLLMIAGVIAGAVGMTLRRRQGSRPATEGNPETDVQPRARPTPDGEIVAGGRDETMVARDGDGGTMVAGEGETVAGRERNL